MHNREKNNKCCIDIIKWQLFWDREKNSIER